jgi:hypothetical protein
MPDGHAILAAAMSAGPSDPSVGDRSADDWLGEQGGVDWNDTRYAGSSSSASEVGARPDAGREDVPRPAPPTAADARRQALVQRRRVIGVVALLALALVGVGVGLTVFRDDEPSAQTTAPVVTAQPPPTPPPATPPATTAPTEAPLRVQLPEDGRLALGDRGDEVETLQTALAALELDPGEVDGIFGEATREAVIAFQQANELTADGIVGADTVRALNAELAAQGVTR